MQTRKNNRVQTILQILLVVGLCGIGLLIIAGMGAFKQTSTSRSLVFRVKSSEGVSYITFQAAGTAIPDTTEVNTPWVKNVDTTVGDEVYLTAYTPTENGTLSCEIFIDGRLWKSDSNKVPTEGVACAGIVP
jgi:hypothetical protein